MVPRNSQLCGGLLVDCRAPLGFWASLSDMRARAREICKTPARTQRPFIYERQVEMNTLPDALPPSLPRSRQGLCLSSLSMYNPRSWCL